VDECRETRDERSVVAQQGNTVGSGV